jgi:hypothetical protein
MLVLAVGTSLSPTSSSAISSFCSRTLAILALVLPYETPPSLNNKCTADGARVSKLFLEDRWITPWMVRLDLMTVSLIYFFAVLQFEALG